MQRPAEIASPILVTGVSGFLGEHLTRRLLSQGHTVAGTYLTHPLEVEGLDARAVDLSNDDQTRAMIEEFKPRTIFHTAAQTNIGYCQEHPIEAKQAIIGATKNLVESVSGQKWDVSFVMVSSDQVYDGKHPSGVMTYREEDEAHPLSLYGRYKRDAEDLVS